MTAILRFASISRSVLNPSKRLRLTNISTQTFRSEARTRSVGLGRQKTLKEALNTPTLGTPFTIGHYAALSAAGLGALCLYGSFMGSWTGADKDRAILNQYMWPDYVRERIRTTYEYLGSSLFVTAGSAIAATRSAALMRVVGSGSLWVTFLGLGAVVGSSMIVQSIPYKEGINTKQFAWLAHSAIMGAWLAPIVMVGGPLLARAALCTAGIVGSLSAVAVCSPSEKFLNMAGPLSIGLGLVFAASLGSCFVSPGTAFGASLFSFSIYGGLILFSMFVLYDTQKIIKKAEQHPRYSMQPYDPVNASISLYMDIINIFIRMVTILGMGGQKKR